MADLAQPSLGQLPGVLGQLKLVGGLRWSILRNSLRNKSSRRDLIGIVTAGVASGTLVIGLCVAFYVGTYFFLTKGHANWMALLFWAIFLWWQVIPVLVAGFGANFEFKSLLRFPLSLKAFYLLGLGYGFADFAAVSSVCWIGSILVAATIARIGAVPVLLVVCLLFLLLNVTLERLVGSWLEKLLAKRRARELFIGIFLLAMVSMNFLSPFLQRYRKSSEPNFLHFLLYLGWTPASLAGNAIPAAGSYGSHSALIGLAGLSAWLIALSTLLWFRFKAQYLGEEISESAAPEKQRKKARFGAVAGVVSQKSDLHVRGWESLPFLSPQVFGMMAKEFRCARRMGNLPLTERAFVRILSNPAFSPNALTPGDALVLLEANLGHPAHHFWADEINFGQALESFVARLTGHQKVTDAYLLGLAVHKKGSWSPWIVPSERCCRTRPRKAIS